MRGATILERSDDWVAARIEFSYLKVRFGFQTRNPKRRPEWLQVRLVEGPFRHFQADWHCGLWASWAARSSST